MLFSQVWSADIVNPATKKKYVNNVTSVDITNVCWNSILYTCQCHEVSFLVRSVQTVWFHELNLNSRFLDGCSHTSDYDIITVTQSVTYIDGSSGYHTYCNHMTGKTKN